MVHNYMITLYTQHLWYKLFRLHEFFKYIIRCSHRNFQELYEFKSNDFFRIKSQCKINIRIRKCCFDFIAFKSLEVTSRFLKTTIHQVRKPESENEFLRPETCNVFFFSVSIINCVNQTIIFTISTIFIFGFLVVLCRSMTVYVVV